MKAYSFDSDRRGQINASKAANVIFEMKQFFITLPTF